LSNQEDLLAHLCQRISSGYYDVDVILSEPVTTKSWDLIATYIPHTRYNFKHEGNVIFSIYKAMDEEVGADGQTALSTMISANPWEISNYTASILHFRYEEMVKNDLVIVRTEEELLRDILDNKPLMIK